MLHTIFLYAAAGMSCAACLAHILVGTAKNAAPILNNLSLEEGPRTTMTFSWESNSILMMFMAVGFLLGAVKRDASLVYFVTALSICLAVWGVIVALRLSHNPMTFPPAILFLVIAVFGAVGATAPA
ncbi:hypothetical protein [Yoonia sp. BS5-3]|uniref:Uncharacterized protein n=1 Tax=Yoonia phaeophyticola TaxID=3137369 RepID=A0ABZ2V7A2_9RHOB